MIIKAHSKGQKEYMRDYYRKNKDILSTKAKKRYKENRKNIILKTKKRSRTKAGLVTKIYSAQRASSKRRGYSMPEYTNKELKRWIFSQKNFNKLYNDWVASGYKKELCPSVDRINDYKSYTLENIQLITWKENFDKANKDMKEGRNNKISIPVDQYTLYGELIKRYYSVAQAHRKTGIKPQNIHSTCRGVYRQTGGYKWKYSEGPFI